MPWENGSIAMNLAEVSHEHWDVGPQIGRRVESVKRKIQKTRRYNPRFQTPKGAELADFIKGLSELQREAKGVPLSTRAFFAYCSPNLIHLDFLLGLVRERSILCGS
jgi:hypothetical protein